LAAPKPGQERAFERWAKGLIFVAWTYEIVRRLPNLKSIGKKISKEDLKSLKNLPPYPVLGWKERALLENQIGAKMSVILQNPRSPRRPDYTEKLPPWAFISRKCLSTNS
jgi:hypothetical protein